MRTFLFFALLFVHSLAVSYETDFDTVVVGTSPIPMIEALYRAHLGERVLVVEESERCGGAWKSISICGVPHADLGCHQIGSDPQVRGFLEDYIGCKMVCLDHPDRDYVQGGSNGSGGFYPAGGCNELIENILQLYAASDITLLVGEKLESVFIDEEKEVAHVRIGEEIYSTAKIVATPSSFLNIENHPSGKEANSNKIKYYHVYLLIEDPAPPSFSYKYGGGTGISRLMNVTHFAGLIETGMQLIAIQTHNNYYLDHHDEFFAQLKMNNLISEDAVMVRSENFIYEQSHLDNSHVNPYKSTMIEVLNTGHFLAMSSYVSKWKMVLKPFQEALIAQ